jgi:hypothetical protein
MSADYASLLIDAGEYSGRSDIAQHFDRFLRFAEAKFNRTLRVSDMETEATVSLIDGDGNLPTDFLEAREVLMAPRYPLRAMSLQLLTSRYGSFGGQPKGYSVIGNRLSARPTWTGDLALTYYASIPALTIVNPTNWLLTKAPDVYLYAVVEEIATWANDMAKAATAQGQRIVAMSGLSLQDERARWGNAQVGLEWPTP